MNDGALILEMQRVIPAPPARVYDAFTDPAQLARWWGPEGFAIPSVEFEPRPGAHYRIEMQPPEGDSFFLHGEVRAAEAPALLSYTFVWDPPDPDDVETLVELSFAASDGATEVHFRQGEFSTDARLALHRDGWTDTFAKLARFLAE